MKNIFIALVTLTILTGCDAGTGNQQSAVPIDAPRKSDDAQKF